jgi:hypothetical protein
MDTGICSLRKAFKNGSCKSWPLLLFMPAPSFLLVVWSLTLKKLVSINLCYQ